MIFVSDSLQYIEINICYKSMYDYFGRFVYLFVCLMLLNATFNNISVISWRSVLLLKETGGHGENHQPVASH